MDTNLQDQERLHEDFWINIEKNSGDVAEFVRYYLMFKKAFSVRKEDVYDFFKDYTKNNFDNNKIKILEDLAKHSIIYSYFNRINQFKNNKKIDDKLERLNKLEFTICFPYLFDVFSDLENKILNEEDVFQILDIIESYAFRKILVDSTTQGLNKLFITLSRDIKKIRDWENNYVDILKFNLLEKKLSQRFPRDEEFENALMYKEIYLLQAKNKNFLLESLENYNSSAKEIDVTNFQIEHIMPQTLTDKWKKMLGNDWKEIHDKYLNTIGNLTLLLPLENIEASNNSFEKKQEIAYEESKILLHYKMSDQDIWNEEKIVERAKVLISKAKEIWPFINTNYSLPKLPESFFTLDSNDDFSNTKPHRLMIDGVQLGNEMIHWREIMLNVLEYFYKNSPTEFNELIINKYQNDFNSNKEEIKKAPLKLDFMDKMYVSGWRSTNNIISFLNKMCKDLNYDPEKIEFSILNIKE